MMYMYVKYVNVFVAGGMGWMMESSRKATGQRVKTKYFIILLPNKELLYNLIIKGLKVVFCEIDWPFWHITFPRKKSKVQQYLENIWKNECLVQHLF